MSTPFDVRRWAEQAGIHTTGGFSVVAECVTLDELQRFADIAIATAAKHWQRTHAITALAMEERQEMSTPFNPEWLKPGAAVEVSMDNLAAYHAEVQRLMEENATLRAALAEPNKCTHGVTDGNCKECYMAEPDQEPLEYWNAVEGWVKIDEIRQHFDSVGCGTIYKTSGDGRQPLYTAPPQRKPLSDEEIIAVAKQTDSAEPGRDGYILPVTFARAIEQAHGIKGEA